LLCGNKKKGKGKRSAVCRMSVTLGAPFLSEKHAHLRHMKIRKASFARHGGHFGILIGKKRLYLEFRRVFTRFRVVISRC
jgi:hypothetical protein